MEQEADPGVTRPLGGTAVSCSGGGIRSASYSLGALEALSAAGVGDPRIVSAVSGGSYMAAAGAAAGPPHGPAGGYLSRFEPFGAIETRLREHSHYLVPDAVVGLRGVLSLLWGTLGNMLLIGSLVYVVSALTGWLLTALGSVTWAADHTTSFAVTALQMWVPAGLGLAAALAFVMSRVTERPPGSAGPLWCERWQTWTAVLLALAAVAAVLLVAMPAAFSAVWNAAAPGKANTSPLLGSGFVALPVIFGGAMVFAKAASGTISAAWRDLKPLQGTIRPWLAKAGRLLTPWMGSAFVALALLAFAAYVIGSSTAPGYPHWYIAVAAGVFAVMHAVMDVNRSSMHDFYRDRLASAYADRAAASTRLSEVSREPDLVLCASANIQASARGGGDQRGLGSVPPGRGAISCTFTPDRIGWYLPGPSGGSEYARTRTYEDLIRWDRMTLFDLVAISGAAIAPVMGRMTSAARRLLFGAVNLRLGVWLPRPALVRFLDGRTADIEPDGPAEWYGRLTLHEIGHRPGRVLLAMQMASWDKVRHHHQAAGKHAWWRPACMWFALRWRIGQPNLLLLWREVAGRNTRRASWAYLTDGGHFDNLGLVEALRRHPARIYLIDASGDPEHKYTGLGQAIALARSELGVEVSIEPASMEEGLAKDAKISGRVPDVARPFATGTFRYTRDPDAGQAGELAMIKLGVWPGQDLPWDVRAYFANHRTFPRDSTLKQLYNDDDFEAYRELGHASMRALLAHRASEAAQRAEEAVEVWIIDQG